MVTVDRSASLSKGAGVSHHQRFQSTTFGRKVSRLGDKSASLATWPTTVQLGWSDSNAASPAGPRGNRLLSTLLGHPLGHRLYG